MGTSARQQHQRTRACGRQLVDQFLDRSELSPKQAAVQRFECVGATRRSRRLREFLDRDHREQGRVVIQGSGREFESRQNGSAREGPAFVDEVDRRGGSRIDDDCGRIRGADRVGGNRIEQAIDARLVRFWKVDGEWKAAAIANVTWERSQGVGPTLVNVANALGVCTGNDARDGGRAPRTNFGPGNCPIAINGAGAQALGQSIGVGRAIEQAEFGAAVTDVDG